MVQGQVRGPDGRPVAGARVVVTAAPVPVPEIAAVTDAEGRFELPAPAPGEYAFTAHAEEAPGRPATASVHVPAPAAGLEPTGPAAAAPVSAGDDDTVSSDDPRIEAAGPAEPVAEVHVVLTFPA